MTMTTKKIFACLLIFCSVFTILGLPFKQWGFKTDDFGTLYASKTICSKGFKAIFSTGNIEATFYPSNSQKSNPQSFFSGLYRPGTLLWYYPQFLLFKTQPYGYFLTTILIHACNSVLFFLMLTAFFPIATALLLSLFFAFHPSLANWIGWISAQTYFAELLLFFLIFISLYYFFRSNNWYWYSLSLLLFAYMLFMKEVTIIFPFLISIAGLFLNHPQTKNPLQQSLYYSSGFWAISLFYCAVRGYIMGINSTVSTFAKEPTLKAYAERLAGRFFDFVTYIADLCMLTALPKNHQFAKGCILFFIFAYIIFCFYKSTKKKQLLFLIVSILIFSWPIILIHYQPRYLYLLLPMMLTLFGFCLQEIKFSRKAHSYIMITLLGLLLFNTKFIFSSLEKRQKVFNATNKAFHTLVTSPDFKQKRTEQPIILAALPEHWFAMGNAQAIWLLSNTTEQDFPIYQFGPSVNLSWQHCYLDKPFKKDCPITIQETSKGFLFTSQNIKQVTFNEKKQEALLLIPQGYLDQKPLVFTWDYKNGNFNVLKNYDDNHI